MESRPPAPLRRRAARTAPLLLAAGVALLAAAPARGITPPLKTDILTAGGEVRGQAWIYGQQYIELYDARGTHRGTIGVVPVEGRLRLFLVRRDGARTLIGWAENHRLYDAAGALQGYYAWTPIRSYVYTTEMKKVGEARCLAYQGICAAGVAGVLLGLLPAEAQAP